MGVSSTICIVEVPRTQLADRAERVLCLPSALHVQAQRTSMQGPLSITAVAVAVSLNTCLSFSQQLPWPFKPSQG